MTSRAMVKVTLSADSEDDLMLALRAAKYLMKCPADRKDAILAYGDEPTKDFYVRRGKQGVIVRPCYRVE